MKVLTFAFDSREPSDYLPHTYTRTSVCYTGTQSSQNWTWRATKGYLTAALSKRIYRLTELYGRLEIEKEETNG